MNLAITNEIAKATNADVAYAVHEASGVTNYQIAKQIGIWKHTIGINISAEQTAEMAGSDLAKYIVAEAVKQFADIRKMVKGVK